MRFDRDYELIVNGVVVRPPLQITFSVTKSIVGGLNKANINIFNLKESNRLQIVKDKEERKRIPVQLKVGYMGNLQTIFKGTVERGTNARQGTDFISSLECLDGGNDFKYSFTSKTIASKQRVIDELIKDMPNTTKGKITDFAQLERPKVLVGNTYQLIEGFLGENDNAFIDNETINIIKDNELTGGFIPLVNAKTGLINTPERDNGKVKFDTLMNPTIKIGQQCQLESVTAPHLNGTYKVETIVYSGTYDGAEWKQQVEGFIIKGAKVL